MGPAPLVVHLDMTRIPADGLGGSLRMRAVHALRRALMRTDAAQHVPPYALRIGEGRVRIPQGSWTADVDWPLDEVRFRTETSGGVELLLVDGPDGIEHRFAGIALDVPIPEILSAVAAHRRG